MPRIGRQIAPGSVQHVISRFVDRSFRMEVPGAREAYLCQAERALARTDWRALGFALMSSHVHWVFLAGSRPSASVLQPLHVGFAAWLNRAEGRLGPVFAERHRNVTFEGQTSAALLAYVHNNPVRAGLVKNPLETSWTSHRAYLGRDPTPPWLDVEFGLHLSGFSASPSGRLAFHEMVCTRAANVPSDIFDANDLAKQRCAARQRAGGPVEIAAPTARAHPSGWQLHTNVMMRTPCSLHPRRDGHPLEVLQAVEAFTGIELAAMRSKVRLRRVSHARRLALLVWTREFHRAAIEMARFLGLSSSSAAGLMATASQEACEAAYAIGQRVRASRRATEGAVL